MGQGVALMLSVRVAVVFAVFSMLASCGSEKYQGSPLVQAVGAVAKATVGKAAAKRAGATEGSAAPAPVTRGELEKYGLPILRAVIAARGADALLTISDTKGSVVTWSTTDSTTFTLRDGVLIQTRGLGPDLMSAQAPSLAALRTDGSKHQRIYFLLGADDRSTRRTYDCTVSVGGQEVIEVFGRSHRVTHVTENCSRPQDSIANEFWIEGSVIRKSRQLASGGAGFIDFEQVVD